MLEAQYYYEAKKKNKQASIIPAVYNNCSISEIKISQDKYLKQIIFQAVIQRIQCAKHCYLLKKIKSESNFPLLLLLGANRDIIFTFRIVCLMLFLLFPFEVSHLK